ncbi:MAG: hypothetical protein JNL96_25615 [Planctomycetaceae bacterium]|nr:hypothetical protein [Planctomycetaceae bacterium]
MAKREQRPKQLTPAQQRTLLKQLKQYARTRSTSLAWYHGVGTLLRDLAPKSSKRSIEGYAADIFENEKFKTTLYACRRFGETIRPRELSSLDGLNWAVVHHLIYADAEHRPAVIKKLQAARRKKERLGGRLTPQEARLIVQEISGKSAIRRAKLSKVPELGPKSALREVTRLSKDWIRYCERFVEVAAAEADRRRAKRVQRKTDSDEWQNLLDEAQSAIEELNSRADSLAQRLGPRPIRANKPRKRR